MARMPSHNAALAKHADSLMGRKRLLPRCTQPPIDQRDAIPETGRNGPLPANRLYTLGNRRHENRRGAPILELLFQLAAAPAFTVRMRWLDARHTLAIWDNRCVWQSSPYPNYFGNQSEMFVLPVVVTNHKRGEVRE